MSEQTLIALIGWTATGLFSLSYFYKEPRALRRAQALAASVWIAYGVLIGSAPVVVANAIVAALALGSSLRRSEGEGDARLPGELRDAG